jgi:hypothetical protein
LEQLVLDGWIALALPGAVAHANSLFDAAWIEIEPRTKLIRRLEVERNAGRGTAPFSLTFTFLKQDSLPAGEYQAQMHLPSGGELLGPDQAAERDRRFRELIRTRRHAAVRAQEPADRLPVHNQ